MVTPQPTMATDTSPETTEYHHLSDNWSLWAHLPHDTDWSINSYKVIYDMETVEGTIAIIETLPEVLVKNCMNSSVNASVDSNNMAAPGIFLDLDSGII